MGIACLNKQLTALAAGALLVSLSLRGCATDSSLMDAQAEARATSVDPSIDLLPERERPAMTVDERLKLQKELIAARDRQASAAKARPRDAPRAEPVKP